MIRAIVEDDLINLNKFVSNIDDDFIENQNINSAPWKYFHEKHFRFFGNFIMGSINAVMVSSIHAESIHLNFLYTLNDKRSSGIGSRFMKFLIENRGEKKLITIHVRKELKRTIQYYDKFRFIEAAIKNGNNPELKSWINKSLIYDSNTYSNKILMYREFK